MWTCIVRRKKSKRDKSKKNDKSGTATTTTTPTPTCNSDDGPFEKPTHCNLRNSYQRLENSSTGIHTAVVKVSTDETSTQTQTETLN